MTETVEPRPQQDWSPEMFEYLYGLAETIARSVHRTFPMVDLEDLLQEALMWAVAHPGTLEGYLADEDEQRCTRMVLGAMKNTARKYARKVRAADRGGDHRDPLSDDVWYPLGALKGTGRTASKRGLLHHVYDDGSWLSPEKTDDEPGRNKQDPAEGGNWLATLADVSRALDLIPDSDRDLIEAHFKNGMTYAQIGLGLHPPVSDATVSKRMDRAVKKVQEFLGGAKPREDPAEPGWENGLVGTRRAISNANARALTDGAYE